MSNLRLVYLESDDVGAVVSVLRELQSMPRGFVAAPLPLPAKRERAIQEVPAAAPPPVPAAARALPAAANGLKRGPSGRVSGASEAVLEAYRAEPEPDRKKLAKDIYGDADPENIKRVQRTVWRLVENGVMKKLASGGYKVMG